ncbi:MAG: ATP-binding cassette domain-containing protein [Candidatus Omnitrophica bacterium]|nr:ATP-binding cassette domain-containing protein [Candidatus Omnitrophota bacterium]
MEDIVLELKNVNHWFGSGAKQNNVLYDLNLKIRAGQIVSLIGPSGCGKSVLLRAIVGTHPPREGHIIVHASDNVQSAIMKHKPGRDVGIVYQQYSLFPFLTAVQNVAFGLMLDQTNIPFRAFRPFKWRHLRKQHLAEAATLLERLKLKNAIHKYPSEMSGGMCQRVAIAQALIMKPMILLLDEPFGALDEATRTELQDMLLTLYAENNQTIQAGQRPPYTIIIVTHELNEAIRVGDRVIGLSMNWNWRKDHAIYPGTTIVYDKRAPIFLPEQEIDYAMLKKQKEEISHAVFDASFQQDRDEFRQFWSENKTGRSQDA